MLTLNLLAGAQDEVRWRRSAARENARRVRDASLFVWAGLVPLTTARERRAQLANAREEAAAAIARMRADAIAKAAADRDAVAALVTDAEVAWLDARLAQGIGAGNVSRAMAVWNAALRVLRGEGLPALGGRPCDCAPGATSRAECLFAKMPAARGRLTPAQLAGLQCACACHAARRPPAWDAVFVAGARRTVRSGPKTTGATQTEWAGRPGTPFVGYRVRITVRTRVAGENFLTSANHRLRGSHVGSGGYFLDVQVLEPAALNDAARAALAAVVEAGDEGGRPARVRLARERLRAGGVGVAIDLGGGAT